MHILSVDLAAKFSAAMVVDDDRWVHWEDDSSGFNSGTPHTPFGFLRVLREIAEEFDPAIILVEDVPYGISQQAMVKPPLRYQGMLIREFSGPLLDRLFFLNPSTWQYTYPGVARAPKGLTGRAADEFRQQAAAGHAVRLGYQPPDIVNPYVSRLTDAGQRVLKKNTDVLNKALTDYVDAFLIADWGHTHAAELLLDPAALSGVQRPAI